LRAARLVVPFACALLAPGGAVAFEGSAGIGLDRLLTLPAADPHRPPLASGAFAGRAALGLAPQWAEPPATRSWLRDWGPTLVLAAALATAEFGFDPPREPRWSRENAFDDGVRDVLRGRSRSVRERAGTAGDALFGGMLVLLVSDWYALRGEYGLTESVRTELPWLLGNNVATLTAKLAAGRARPFVRPCREDPNYLSDCGRGRSANTSFYSGHSSNAAAVAGLLCARHLHRSDPAAADRWTCGFAVAGALATGILRMTAEMHFATDVLVGWASGALFGYVLPSRFHFRREPDRFGLPALTPLVGPDFYGLRYDIRF